LSGAYIGKMSDGSWQVCGELSFASVPGLLKRGGIVFEPEDDKPLCIDLAGVPRADSAGLALLVCWVRQARRHNVRLVFRNVPNQMLKIAGVSGLDGILPLTESRNSYPMAENEL